MKLTTTIEESIEACKILADHGGISGLLGTIPKTDGTRQIWIDATTRLEKLKELANDEKSEPQIIDGKYQDWDSTKDPQFAPEIEEQIKKRMSQNDNSLYNPIWFARDFRSGARFAIQLIQSKLKELL